MSVSESTVRARLGRKGYALSKSRTRNEDHPAHGQFMIVCPYRNFAVAGIGSFGPDLTIEEADEWSLETERNPAM